MKILSVFITLVSIFLNCKHPTTSIDQKNKKTNPITCSKNGCSGAYVGPEFINQSDVAHQFSNTISKVVGDKLKELYQAGIYNQVDFKNIVMTTQGMGSGQVTYYLSIPFKQVVEKCEAYTSFDHVGGWNHTPELSKRKEQLSPSLLESDQLSISELKKTPEGLQEYWFQWRHKETQKECKNY